jgi:phosphoribosyl-ATP pyrophosphohydrolase/phosphoribosyl-AMP cyclohydrolase
MRPDFKKMNGLVPAIVQDVESKEVLMLAYVNEESYEYMLKNKETCFYSRSRQTLWHKGETSGHIQKIVGMYLDCDQDTLLIFVHQKGAACHTGSYSCFFEEVFPYECADPLDRLYDVIDEKEVDQESLISDVKTKADAFKENVSKETLEDLYYDLCALVKKSGHSMEEIEQDLLKKYPVKGHVKKINYHKG